MKECQRTSMQKDVQEVPTTAAERLHVEVARSTRSIRGHKSAPSGGRCENETVVPQARTKEGRDGRDTDNTRKGKTRKSSFVSKLGTAREGRRYLDFTFGLVNVLLLNLWIIVAQHPATTV